jgi:uncharacterized protein DUF1707
MSTDRWMRASDQDRERAAELLRDAYVAGRLSREEFDGRIAAAYSARTYGELRDLTADIPALPTAGLPSDAVTRPDIARSLGRRASALMMWTYLLVVTVTLVGRVFPAIWMIWAVSMVPLFAFAAWGPCRRRPDRSGQGGAGDGR